MKKRITFTEGMVEEEGRGEEEGKSSSEDAAVGSATNDATFQVDALSLERAEKQIKKNKQRVPGTPGAVTTRGAKEKVRTE
jgi:hypothetical protein